MTTANARPVNDRNGRKPTTEMALGTSTENTTSLRQYALDAHDAGLCVVPPKQNGSKRPFMSWEEFETERPSRELVEQWYGPRRTGIGYVGGAISGGLEMFEFEGRAIALGLDKAFVDLAEERGHADLMVRIFTGWTELSPSGGLHLHYRCTETGCEKLAYGDEENGKRPLLIETKGEGGYIVAAPSHGDVHKLGPYKPLHGSFRSCPTISPEERQVLLGLAREFDQRPPPSTSATPPPPPTLPPNGHLGASWMDQVVADFNARTTWPDVLAGRFEYLHQRGDIAYWHYIGADNEESATTNANDSDRLLIFSGTAGGAGWEIYNGNGPTTTYDRFSAHVFITTGSHDIDARTEVARQLNDEGYGQPRRLQGVEALIGSESVTGNTDANDVDTIDAAPDGHRLSDTGNAARLIELHNGRLRYVPAWNRWLIWHKGRWLIDTNDAIVTEKAKKVARHLFSLAVDADTPRRMRDDIYKAAKRAESGAAITQMVRLARGIPGVLLDHEALDADPWILNVRNGTIDLTTGKLRPHRPEDLCSKQIDVDYLPDASAPLWDACLKRWQPDPAIREYLQREAGACATGQPTETVSVHHGTGSNGKGKYFGALLHVLGEYATEPHKSLLIATKHEQHGTVLASLFRIRLAVASETKATDHLNEAEIKNITGGDRLRARRMREDEWSFWPSHTLCLMTNHRPAVEGRDEGIWRRLRLIPWEVTIPTKERDLKLANKLKGEAEGILRWIVEGAVRFAADGFDAPARVTAATDRYRHAEDSVGRFFAEADIKVDHDGRVTSSDLIGWHDQWCRETGFVAADHWPKVTARMRELGAHHGRSNKARWWSIPTPLRGAE